MVLRGLTGRCCIENLTDKILTFLQSLRYTDYKKELQVLLHEYVVRTKVNWNIARYVTRA